MTEREEQAVVVLNTLHDNPLLSDIHRQALEVGIMAIKALEQNVKLKEAIEKMDKWIHSGNRGNCDYFIVDQVEEIITGLKKDGTVSENDTRRT